ncbi:MAG TPA: DUF6121 family protein [Microbacteriaceae bacterium]|nr:DUF6121 family protein [Microbacteriaceae bacterium]
MGNFRAYAAMVALFAAVLNAALVIGVFGPVSLLTGLEVIPEADAGVLLGPAMVLAATLALFAMLLSRIRIPPDEQRVAVGGALAAGVVAGVVYLVVGGLGYAWARSDPLAGFLFVGRQAALPYVFLAAAIAAVVMFLDTLVLASRVGERGRPRWPWEHDGP